jgi:adenylate cyclase
MTQEGLKRKLAAILSADVKEYSRLMREDEVATIQTLTEYRQVIASLINQHHGRVVDSVGDNMLAEFASVVDAVQGAVAIQKEVNARNAVMPEARRMLFRIGINLGDLVVEGDRIYGDGVNIAARLEGIADPGGICISRTAYDQIEDKLPLGYEYLGEKTIKDSPKPIRAYKVIFEPSGKIRGFLKREHKQRTKRKRKKHSDTIQDSADTRVKTKGLILFYKHRRVYLGVIGFLFIINMLTWPGIFWFHWPALGWGIFLFIHWVSVSKSSPQKDR